ncbi:MAG: leucine-rich repeat protein [Rikenellaceae bacterium]
MKKIFLLFLLCVTCATSCKKDDDQIYDVIIFTGDAVEVVTEADLDDLDNSNLEAAVKKEFGTDYRLSQMPLRIKVIGTISSADFETLNYFDEIDLSHTQIVGEIQVGRVVGTPGFGTSITEQWVTGNAIPMSAFINNTKLSRITLASGIPATVDDTFEEGFQAMTYVGVSAFSGCTSLEAVNGLESITDVGSAAFKGCSVLGEDDKVLFGEYLVTLGDNAFADCSLLYEIDLEKASMGLSIGATAFSNCSALYSVVLPNNLSALGSEAFSGCDALETIVAKMGDGISNSDNVTVPTLLSGVIPDQFKASKTNAKIVTIEDVAMPAYSDAGGWSDYNLQASATTGWKIVYNEAAEDSNTVNNLTASLKGVYGSNYASRDNDLKVKVSGTMNQADFTALYTGFNSVDLSDVTIVGSITIGSSYTTTKASAETVQEGNAIPASVFSGSKSKFANFTIPKTVTYIGDAAFEDNASLEELDLDTDTDVYLTIGSAAFRNITNLGGDTGIFGMKSTTALDTLVIPANVGEIKDYAFAGVVSENLTTIELRGDKSAPTIGENAFPDKFKASATVGTMLVPVAAAGLYNTTAWKEYSRKKVDFEADDYASNSVEVEPHCVTNVANESDNTVANIEEQLIAVFGSTYAMEETIIVSGTLNNADFEYLRTFKDVDIKDVTIVGTTLSDTGVTSAMAIPSYAFCGSSSGRNYNLERIVLPTAVGELSTYSLAYCPNLKTIIFPEDMTITAVGTYAFRGCAIEELPGEMDMDADYYNKKSNTGMINFPRRTTYSTGLFYDCTSLHTVDFSTSDFDDLIGVNQAMFQGCTNLSSVKLPEESSNFIYIYTLAFYGCTNLDGITIPDSVMYLGDRSFYNCSSLTSINIPKAVVGALSSSLTLSGTFYGCESLVKVTVNWEDQKSDEQIAAGATQSVVPPAIITYDMNTNYPTFPTAFYGTDATRYITLNGGGESLYKNISGWSGINTLEAGGDNVLIVEAGGLGTALTNAYSLASRVPNTLALSGELNAADLDYINGENYSLTPSSISPAELNIEILDLSEVTFVNDPDEAYTDVPQEAFKDNTKLKIVTLPTKGIEKVLESAFEGCTSLEIVVVPSTATEIEESAFKGCKSLTSISLPNVTAIGESAFSGCSSLASIALSQQIETIGEAAFSGTAITSMVMPAKIEKIADNLFNSCASLTSVTLSSATTSIGKSAFSDCSSMTSITIPKTVTSIDERAFASCDILSSVTFESLTDTDDAPPLTIGEKAFDSCFSMKLFSMPTNFTGEGENNTLADNIFDNCSSLTKIKVYWESGDEPKVSATTFPATFKTGSNAGTIVLPEGESSYSVDGWKNYNVEEAADDTVNTTPGGLEAAILSKWRDFYNMTNDTYPSITVTGSMNSTDFAALQLSTTSSDGTILDHSFKTIDLSDCLIQNNTIPEGAFFENTALGDLTLPESITTIESTAFQGCTNLLSFSFPTSLSSIGSYAFAGTRLLTVTGLRNLTSLGSYAFYACDILSSVDLSYSTELTTTIYTTYFFNGCTSLAKVVLPDHLSILPEYTFSGCTSLTSVTMPSELTYIGERAFQNCTSLETIDIPATVVTIESDSSGCDTFSGCSKLSNVTLNWTEVSAIPTILADAFPSQFLSSSKNKSFSIPSALTEAEYQSVSGWSTFSFETGGANTLTLTGGSLENAIQSKWGGAWDTSIPSEIVVEGTVDYSDLIKWSEIISSNSVKLGACVTSLDMSGLAITGSEADVIPQGFWGDYDYVGTVTKSASDYKLKTLILPSFITKITTEAFKGLSTLTSITMDGVVTIGESAFENCIGLTSIDFADPLTTIGEAAFKNATGLTSFTTPTRTATDTSRHNITIGVSAFEGCVLLSNAALNHGVKSIDDDSFKDCKALTIISLPTTLTSVSSATTPTEPGSPFTNCSSLSAIEVSWSAIPTTLDGFTSSTFPDQFRNAPDLTGEIIASAAFVEAVANLESSDAWTYAWTYYNVGEKSDDMVQSTAGNLATVIALKGNSLSDKITIFGDMNADDFATLASSSFTTIDMKSVNITGVVTVEGTLNSLGNAIPTEGFKGNTYLKEITLPTSMSQIGSSAFYGCTALTQITSGADIVYVGSDAFSGCSSLTFGNFTDVFESTTYVGGNAFSGVTITNVDIPSTLALDETSSFFGCNAGRIVLPWCYGATDETNSNDSLKAPAKIGSTTFPVKYSASGYENLEFDTDVLAAITGGTTTEEKSLIAYTSLANYSEGWSSYRFDENVKTSTDDSYIVILEEANATDKTENRLAAAIAKVPAFYSFNTSTSTTYPKIIVKGQMNQADFASLLRFAEVDLSGVEIVGDICITPTTSSASATYSSAEGWVSAIPSYAFACLADGVSVDTADGGTQIDAFANPTGSGNSVLTKITLPLACQTVGYGAFVNCSALKEIVFPDGMDLRYLQYYAFSRTAITSVTNIPSTLYFINYGAFMTNTSLLSVDLSTASDDLTLGGNIFNGCTNLSSASLPSGFAASINTSTFLNCALTSFTIPAGTTSLAATSFKNITELESIDIPESVTSITSTAFANCSGLKRISVNWTSSIPSVTYDEETPANSTFPVQFHNGSGEDVRILVPANCETLYKTAWPNFSDCIESDVYDTINATADSFEVPASWKGSSAPSTIYIKGKMTSDHFLELKGVCSSKIDMSGVTSVAAVDNGTAENTVCAGAFTGNTNVSTILLPSCITAIGDNAFDGCASLVPEDMTDIMTSIGSRAYAGTLYSSDVVLPLSLTYMGSNVFDDCSITSITAQWYDTVRHTVAEIEDDTFPEVFRTSGTSSIDVPATADLESGSIYEDWFDYYTLECLPSDSFTVASKAGELAEALSSVGIESINPLSITGVMNEDDFITSVDAGQNSWKALREFIEINELKYIDLSSVTLDSSLDGALPAEAFKGLTTLTTISLPSSVLTISDNAFEDCISLTSVTWTTPAGSASIGASAFKGCSKLGSVDDLLNSKLTSVGASAFENCTLLTSLTLSDGVTSYGVNVFKGCSAITSITAADLEIAPSVTESSFPSQFLSGGSNSITVPSTTVYNSWATAGYDIGASDLVDVSRVTIRLTLDSPALPDEGNYDYIAPYYTTAVDGKVASADWGTFKTEFKSKYSDYWDEYEAGSIFGKLEISGNLNVGDFLSIRDRFRSIDFKDSASVGYMQSVWANTSSETNSSYYTVRNDSDVLKYFANGGMYPYYAFYGDTVIEEVVLSTGIAKIGPCGFQNCTSLRSVYVPAVTLSFQSNNFNGCTSLSSFSFADGATPTIDSQAVFANTTSLKSFTIPSTMTKLGAQMFLNSGLTSIDIPATVTTFTQYSTSSTSPNYTRQTFYGCSNLDLITVHWTAGSEPEMSHADISADAFPAEYLSGGSKDIYVPAGDNYNITSYKTGTGLGDYGLLNVGDVRVESFTLYCDSADAYGEADSDFEKQVSSANTALLTKGSDDRYVTILGSLNAKDFEKLKDATAFENIDMSQASSLETEVLYGSNENEAATIPTEAFKGATHLKTITLPTNVYKVGKSAFSGCTALTSVVLPDNGYGMTYIGESAFEGCTLLSSFSNSSMIREIGAKAFYDCSSIPSIGASESELNISGVYSKSKNRGDGIGSEAFVGCTAFQYIYLPWSTAADIPEIAKDFLPDDFEIDSGHSDTADIKWIKVPDGAVETYSTDEVKEITTIAAVYWMAGYNDPQPGQTPEATLESGVITVVNLDSDAGDDDAVPTIGNLSALIAKDITETSSATKIVIGGLINSADFTWLKTQSQFTSIDLSGAVLKGNFSYNGVNSDDFTIPVNAFNGCNWLKEFVLPALVNRIGDSAFNGTGLTTLSVPSMIEYVGSNAYANCSLDSISVEFAPTATVSVTNTSFPSDYLKSGSKSIVIPFGESYEDYTMLTEYYNVIDKPADISVVGSVLYVSDVNSEGLTSQQAYNASYAHTARAYGSSATNTTYTLDADVYPYSKLYTSMAAVNPDLTNVTDIVVTGNINQADVAYLYGMYESIDLSGTTLVGYIHFQTTALSNDYDTVANTKKMILDDNDFPIFAFYLDTKLKEFKFPTNVENTGYTCFSGATNLEKVVLNDKLENLRYDTFYNCTSLSDINLSETVTTIGDRVFWKCTSLSFEKYSDMNLGITAINFQTFYGCTGFKELDIPEGVITICSQSFDICTGVTTLSLPSTFKTLGKSSATKNTGKVFYGCSALESVTLNWVGTETLTYYVDDEAATIFPADFVSGTGTKTITIPKGTTGKGIYVDLASANYNLEEATE